MEIREKERERWQFAFSARPLDVADIRTRAQNIHAVIENHWLFARQHSWCHRELMLCARQLLSVAKLFERSTFSVTLRALKSLNGSSYSAPSSFADRGQTFLHGECRTTILSLASQLIENSRRTQNPANNWDLAIRSLPTHATCKHARQSFRFAFLVFTFNAR